MVCDNNLCDFECDCDKAFHLVHTRPRFLGLISETNFERNLELFPK